jgi:hypothetical protein
VRARARIYIRPLFIGTCQEQNDLNTMHIHGIIDLQGSVGLVDNAPGSTAVQNLITVLRLLALLVQKYKY